MRQHRPVPERVTARVAYDPGIRGTVQNYGDAPEETNFNEVNARHARGEYDGECECTRNLLRYANNARTHSHVMSIEPAEYATDPRILSAQGFLPKRNTSYQLYRSVAWRRGRGWWLNASQRMLE